MKLSVKNENSNVSVDLCYGVTEVTLSPNEVIEIEVSDQDCLYIDAIKDGNCCGKCG